MPSALAVPAALEWSSSRVRGNPTYPVSHAPQERPVSLAEPLPNFDDKTKRCQRREPVVPRGRAADFLALAILMHQLPGDTSLGQQHLGVGSAAPSQIGGCR